MWEQIGAVGPPQGDWIPSRDEDRTVRRGLRSWRQKGKTETGYPGEKKIRKAAMVGWRSLPNRREAAPAILLGASLIMYTRR